MHPFPDLIQRQSQSLLLALRRSTDVCPADAFTASRVRPRGHICHSLVGMDV